jgi:hypothetical protein
MKKTNTRNSIACCLAWLVIAPIVSLPSLPSLRRWALQEQRRSMLWQGRQHRGRFEGLDEAVDKHEVFST